MATTPLALEAYRNRPAVLAPRLRYYSFRTDMHDGHAPRSCAVLGYSISDAVATLRGMLYDGETIVGWN